MHAMSPFSLARLRRAELRFVLAVVGTFVVAGLAWVFATDLVLYAVSRNPSLIARFETAKGWVFVALAALFLYPVLRRRASRLTRVHATLAAVIDCIADGVLLLGRDRTIVHANPAALRMLHCPAGELVGMGAGEFSRRFRVSYPSGALVPPAQYISQRVFDEPGPLQYKAVLHPPGADAVTFIATAAAVRVFTGETAQIVVSVMHDVTESERLQDLRDQFFAAAAHSLKTPVAIIAANAQMLTCGLPNQIARSVPTVERQCRRIDRLVDNLLVLARARSGTLRLYPVEVELGPLVEAVAREMARASRHHAVTAEVTAAPRVVADRERLAMVLRNLIDVAQRSSAMDAPVVVRLRQRDGDAEIAVRHQVGTEAAASAAYLEYDDMGVSRFVTSAIVEAHGGALREETGYGEATAWLRLPATEGGDGGARG